MTESFVIYDAEPDGCDAMMSRTVPPHEAVEPVAAYCDECEERHRFLPKDE